MDKAELAAERDRRSADIWFHAVGVSALIAAAMLVLSAGTLMLDSIDGITMPNIYPYTFAAMCAFLIFAVVAISGRQRALNRVKAHEDANGVVGEERVV